MSRAMNGSLYAATVALLAEYKGEWREIAQACDLPYSSVTKIAQGTHVNPSVHTIERLHAHLSARREADVDEALALIRSNRRRATTEV